MSSENDAVIGEIHCVVTETELPECSHLMLETTSASIIFYDDHPEIIVSCYVMIKIHWPLFPIKCIQFHKW